MLDRVDPVRRRLGYGVDAKTSFRLGPLATGVPNGEIHEPRPWFEYHPNDFGAFVRDPDGNNVEVVGHASD